jgi:tetratricopeptide (TPR) repeat protein
LLERALAIQEATLGPNHPHVADFLGNLALVHEASGEHARSKALLERVLTIREHAQGPTHPMVVQTLNGLALSCWHLGDHEAARRFLERARALVESTQGSAAASADYSSGLLAEVALVQGRWAEAVALGEEVVAALERIDPGALQLAEARLVLARSLWQAPEGEGRDRERAIAQSRLARERLQALGDAGAEVLAEVERWLDEHPEGAPR